MIDTPVQVRPPGAISFRTEMEVSQSWLNEFRLCPERARLEMVKADLPDMSSDATHTGNAVHAFAESYLTQIVDGFATETVPDELTAREAGLKLLTEAEEAGVRLTHAPHWKSVRERFGRACTQWLMWFWNHWDEGHINVEVSEWRIEMPVQFQMPEMPGVTFLGSVDFYDGWSAFDWKSGQIPQEWEVQRWNIQSTIYTEGILALDLPINAFIFVYTSGRQMRDENNKLYLPPPAEIVVERQDSPHISRLLAEIESVRTLISKYGVNEPWPLRTDTWACSEKWCGNWTHCQGQWADKEE